MSSPPNFGLERIMKTHKGKPGVKVAKRLVMSANKAANKARGRLTKAKANLCDAEVRAKARKVSQTSTTGKTRKPAAKKK